MYSEVSDQPSDSRKIALLLGRNRYRLYVQDGLPTPQEAYLGRVNKYPSVMKKNV